MDRDVIKCARDVVTKATMSEILNEDPSGVVVFYDVVRQQILALCTRLKIALVVVDKLMALANTLGSGRSK
jgi:hypothetical protein